MKVKKLILVCRVKFILKKLSEVKGEHHCDGWKNSMPFLRIFFLE